MATADVARLRFILSADAGGLKAGTKEAAGSLKDFNDAAASRGGKGGEAFGEKWFHGMSHKLRGLRHVAGDFGIGGPLGQAMGALHAGAAFGAAGVGVAGVGIGYEMMQQSEEKRERDRQKAEESFRGARAHGLDFETYHNLESVAGDDKQFLDSLADGMKHLKDAGPGASESLKQFGRDLDKYKETLGLTGAAGKDITAEQKMLAAEKMMSDAGAAPNTSLQDVMGERDDPSLKLLQNKLHLSEAEMDKFSAKGTPFDRPFFGKPIRQRVASLTGGYFGDDEYRKRMGEYFDIAQKEQNTLRDENELRADPNLKSNKEKLTDRLGHLRDLKKGGADDELIGRATKDALDEYRKAQGGPIGMAGAAVAGSEEAYSIVAKAQMGAAAAGNDTATTNAILEKSFPELIKAVEKLNPNWRKADAAI